MTTFFLKSTFLRGLLTTFKEILWGNGPMLEPFRAGRIFCRIEYVLKYVRLNNPEKTQNWDIFGSKMLKKQHFDHFLKNSPNDLKFAPAKC